MGKETPRRGFLRVVTSERFRLEDRDSGELRAFLTGVGVMVLGTGLLLVTIVLVLDWLMPADSVAGRGVAAADSPPDATGTGHEGISPVPEPDPERTLSDAVLDDDVGETFRAIRSASFNFRGDVTTGRFLEDFVPLAAKLDHIDQRKVDLKKRGRGWVLLEAPYRPVGESAGSAQLRFVREEGRWKLENLRISTERNRP